MELGFVRTFERAIAEYQTLKEGERRLQLGPAPTPLHPLNGAHAIALSRPVLENLLGNSWKFTSKRPHPRIEVGPGRGADKGFFVRDNSAGFDMTHAQKLFSPFQRFHSEAEFEGTGIGLATIQRIVSRHESRVWAEAATDRGATFFVTLRDV